METHTDFPPYTGVAKPIEEGDIVELESGKKFVYAITTTGYPGRYRAFSPRQEIVISGMEFDGKLPIKVSEPSENITDGTTTMEVTTSIDIQELEEIQMSINVTSTEDSD